MLEILLTFLVEFSAMTLPLIFALFDLVLAGCGPDPPLWPKKFTLVQRRIPDVNSTLVDVATTVTYYDYEAGANLIIITPDANESNVLWDLELNSKKSFYFTPSMKTCTSMDFPVGIIRPGTTGLFYSLTYSFTYSLTHMITWLLK